jgi:hypothetical protein
VERSYADVEVEALNGEAAEFEALGTLTDGRSITWVSDTVDIRANDRTFLDERSN